MKSGMLLFVFIDFYLDRIHYHQFLPSFTNECFSARFLQKRLQNKIWQRWIQQNQQYTIKQSLTSLWGFMFWFKRQTHRSLWRLGCDWTEDIFDVRSSARLQTRRETQPHPSYWIMTEKQGKILFLNYLIDDRSVSNYLLWKKCVHN